MTRFTCRWVAEHPAEFLELCKPPPECPICYEPFTEENPALGPIMGDQVTSCRHFACQSCWCAMSEQPMPWQCPQCREDVTQWVVEATYWSPMPGECVDESEVRLFVELSTTILESRALVPELQALGARLLRHLP